MLVTRKHRSYASARRASPSFLIAATIAVGCASSPEAPQSTAAMSASLSLAAREHFDAVVVDLDAYWASYFADDYSPPTVMAYRRGEIPHIACADGTAPGDWSETAFYCFEDQTLVYDEDFLAEVHKIANPNAASAILAHEWGHHLQAFRGQPAFSLQTELQADCYSGFFMGSRYGSLEEVNEVSDSMERLVEAGNELYSQSSWFDETEHGSPGLRVVAFTMGALTGVFSAEDIGFCDDYARYEPGEPIELGPYSLAHLPGFEHRPDSSGVSLSRGQVHLRLEPVPASDLPGVAADPPEQVAAAWDAYSEPDAWDHLEIELDAPVVSERPTGMFVTTLYVGISAGASTFGSFTLHRAGTGEALVIDSSARIPSEGTFSEATQRDMTMAQTLGLAIEQFLCVPGQSGDPHSPDYFFSCDLEHEP